LNRNSPPSSRKIDAPYNPERIKPTAPNRIAIQPGQLPFI
jgi:hypothetical protein